MRKRIIGIIMAVALLCGTIPAAAAESSPGAPNVSAWADPAILSALNARLVPADMYFNEDMKKPMTREEIAALGVALFEKATANVAEQALPNPFTDTTSEDVLKALKLGILSGVTETTFAPGGTVTKEQAAMILGRTLEAIMPEIDLQASGTVTYKDHKDISQQALKYVLYLSERRIFSGSDGKFMPLSVISREQVVFNAEKMFENLSSLSKPLYRSPYVKIGDYVQFGHYLGDSILWRVVDINQDGNPMLFSEKVLCHKPYDAAESGTADKMGKKNFAAEEQGSSRWLNSNIREWLNSSEAKVKYSTQPPVKAAISGGFNAYSDEAGFLSGFTAAEQKMLAQVSHKAELAIVDHNYAVGGTCTLMSPSNYKTPSEALWIGVPFLELYHEIVTDKVFLPSLEEMKMIQDEGIDWKRSPTAKAKKQHTSYSYGDENGKVVYWLRTAVNSNRSGIVCYISYDGTVNGWEPYAYQPGVCPALYLDIKSVKRSGDGSMKKPYIFTK